jgi:two-component system, cell cycle sensor histidine kinase and response regulator CckA
VAEAIRVLIAEDTPADAELVVRELRRSGFEPDWRRVDTEADYLQALAPELDIILSDYSMPQFDGPRALRLLQESGLDVPFILVSGTVGEDAAVAAMRGGASDYLLKDRLARLGTAVRHAIDERREREERRRIEARLHENVRLLVQQAPVCIAMFDRDMRYLAASQRWIEEYGRGHAELIGRCHYDISPDLPEVWREAHRRGQAGEVVKNDEDTWLQADGSRHWLRWAVHPWRDAQGEIGGIIISTEDITSHKQAAAQRDELAQQRGLALGAARLGWWHYDPLTGSASWDERFREIFGVSELARSNEGILARVHPADLPLMSAAVETALDPADPMPYAIEYRLNQPEGSERWVEAHGVASFEGEGDQRRATSLVGTVQDITERKQMSAALASASAKYRNIFENAVNGIFQTTPDGRFLAANPAMAHICGYSSPEELIATVTNLKEQLYADPARREEFDTLAEGTDVIPGFEVQLRKKDGSLVWVSSNARVVRDEQGNPHYEGIVVDISARKQAEAAVQEGEARLAGVVNSAMDAIITVDAEQRIVLFNAAAERMFRCSRGQAMGRPIDVFIPARFREGHGQHVQRFGTTGVTSRSMGALGAISGLRADGEEFPIEASISQTDVAGKRLYTVILRDVTERRRAERWQAMQHAVTQVLADSTSLSAAAPAIIQAVCETLGGKFGAIWEIDRQANVLRCADVWHAAGLSADELEAQSRQISFAPGIGLAGRVWASGKPLLVPDVTQDANFPRAAAAKKAGLQGAFAFPIQLRDEVLGVIDFLAPQMREPEPDLSAMLSAIGSQMGQFIEHRVAEQQLLQAQKMEAVGQLAGGIAHDFNNLLGVILGYGELALKELGPDHPSHRRVEAIRKAAQRAAALTRQILTFSRKQPVEIHSCDLNHIVEEMEKMLRRLIGEDVRLAVALGEGLGRVSADPNQLEQVIMNLVVNARDAMPSGGRLTIETANVELDEAYVRSHPEARPGPYVALTVTDSGVGMERATLARIFEPFFTTKELGKGTGLGLAVVYGIVKQSGGSLSVHSEPGCGTTFKIYLPRTDARESQEQATKLDAPAGGTELVLLIEDEQALRAIVAETLVMAGYTVLEAADPKDALSIAVHSPRPIQLLITDVVLPGQSGPETARQIRKAQPGVRVLLMSGYAERTPDANASIEPGTPFLGKPFTIDSLLHKVREVLDGPPPISPLS